MPASVVLVLLAFLVASAVSLPEIDDLAARKQVQAAWGLLTRLLPNQAEKFVFSIHGDAEVCRDGHKACYLVVIEGGYVHIKGTSGVGTCTDLAYSFALGCF